jgi:hypothetical protein
MFVNTGAEDPAFPGVWASNSGGDLVQSTEFAHGGTYGVGLTGRTDASSGPGNGSLPIATGVYFVTLFGLFDPGVAPGGGTPLATLNGRLIAKVQCAISGPMFVTIVDHQAMTPNTWTEFHGYLTVQHTTNCGVANDTINSILVYLEQADGTVFPDLYVDDVSAILQ